MDLKDWKTWALFSVTLGLAPFFPEPHIWGKLKWIAGGANGMQLMDGTPWIGLVVTLALHFKRK